MAMELSNVNTTAQDSDAETPPRSAAKPTGFSAYVNGSFKRRHCVTTVLPPPISYRECMRNHAVGIGGHALDGCCEFMPSPDSDYGDPGSLRCAACGCHRNFHRRDPDDPSPLQLHRHRALPPVTSPPATRSFYSGHHISLKKTFSDSAPATTVSPVTGGRKRFRTRFSQEQKEKMYEFSEKLGWKLQKIDKGLIEEFCNEIGVGKEVLKVWMHNNKNTLGRREISSNVNGGIMDGDYKNAGDRVDEKLAGNGGVHNGDAFKAVCVGSGDGSSSSSG